MATGAEESFSNSEKCFEGARSQRFPDLDYFIGDHCRECHGEPNKNCFNRQARPRSDVKPHHRAWPVFPPAVRQSERRFPKQTDQQQQEKCKTKCPPINKRPDRVEKASRWNQRRANQINEIPGETLWRAGKKLPIHNCSGDQQNTEQDRREMKTDDSRYVFGPRGV